MERAGSAPSGGATAPPAPLLNDSGDILLGCPGKLGTRWIRDFIESTLLNEATETAGLATHPGEAHMFTLSHNDFSHDSSVSNEQVALYCQRCLLHFYVYTVNNLPLPGNTSHSPCGTQNFQYPAHHFVPQVKQIGYDLCDEHSPNYHSKYNPIAIIARYCCSAPQCMCCITIEVSPSRIPATLINVLTDKEGLQSRASEVVEADMMSAKDAKEWSTRDQALIIAVRVLTDLIRRSADSHTLKKIDTKNNKKLRIIFGGSATEVLRYFELRSSGANLNSAAVDKMDCSEDANDSLWVFPPPLAMDGNISGYTGNQTSFYEECRTELGAMVSSSAFDPQGAIEALRTIILGIAPMEKRPRVATEDHDNHWAYQELGVLRQDVTKLVLYAFEMQKRCCPLMQKRLVEALSEISILRSDDELQMRAAQESSFLDVERPIADTSVQELADKAYRYLATGIEDLSLIRRYSDSFLIGLCRNRLDSCPSDDEAIHMMEILADVRSSLEIRTYIEKVNSQPSRIMTVTKALEVLEMREMSNLESFDPDFLVNVAIANASQSNKYHHYVGKALSVLAQNLDNHPILLAEAAKKVSPALMLDFEATTTEAKQVDYMLPSGLDNIGNTCYLNSILQYLYTLKPIRKLLANFDAAKLDLSPESIANRRIGGNKTRLERAEAIAAQQFVEELRDLFEKLHRSPKASTKPKQRLANAALLSVPQLLANAKKQKQHAQLTAEPALGPAAPDTSPAPPELPPRPMAPAPASDHTGAFYGVPSPPPSESDAVMTVDIPKSTAPADQETASRSSTQTLVNNEVDMNHTQPIVITDGISNPQAPLLPASIPNFNQQKVPGKQFGDAEDDTQIIHAAPEPDKDTSLSGAATPSTTKPDEEDGEVEELIRKALNNSDRAGTAQQDVEEVMGNIMLRLQEAIRSDGEGTLDGKTQIQLDQIMEYFYCVIVNLTAKADGDGTLEEIAHERWITAYPDEKKAISMYEALDRSFDKQFLDGTQRPRYSVIRRLPPILHICIQRSAASGHKNLNKVEIPRTLYLDRYMEDGEDGGLSELRDRAWDLKLRLGRLRAQCAEEGLAATRGADAIEASKHAEEALDAIAFGEILAIDTEELKGNIEYPTLDSETATLNQDTPLSPGEDSIYPAEEAHKIETELEQLWTGRQEYEYKLHAIICHSGAGLGFGHYWVFVYDFERNVWFRYNDETVVEHSHEECMNMIETRGNPYYVAYVRGGHHANLVNIAPRQPDAKDVLDATVEDEDISHTVPSGVVFGPHPLYPTLNTTTIEGRALDENPNTTTSPVDTEMGGINLNDTSYHLPTYEESAQTHSNSDKMDIDRSL